MKKILYINTDASIGGAAIVMQYLHMKMARTIESHIVSGRYFHSKFSMLKSESFGGLLSWCSLTGQQDYYIQKSHYLQNKFLFTQADILHLHNLHGGYFNLWSLPLLSALKPTIWTLHDMQALTGHCAHSLECKRWQLDAGCGYCPSLSSYPPLRRDTTHQLWKDKQTIYKHSALYLVTPSIWLQRLVEKSILKNQPLICIPNGVDTAVYHPQDKNEARRLLNIPQDALLVGGCADGGLANPWKGGQYALETVLELKKQFPSLHFLNIGVKTIPDSLQGADWVHHIPYVHEPAHLARLYAALDLLLYPTLADNHPLVCIESLCCGTPIVGFATGGVPEIVRGGLDGALVPTHDGPALIKVATMLLKDTGLRKKMGLEAAISAARRFNLDLFTERYEKAYEEVLYMPRSLEKSRLPLNQVPSLVKSPAFIRQEWIKYPHPSLKDIGTLLLHSIPGGLCVTLATIAGWPLQFFRSLRSLYRRMRTR